jgi:hypothetical protein
MDDEMIRPDGITSSETAPFGIKSFSLHTFRYRQIQSEMQTVLYEQISPAYPPMDYIKWQTNMHERIQQWYDNNPRMSMPHHFEQNNVARSDTWELTLHRALLFLYRPSPRIEYPSDKGLLVLAESSSRVIQLFRRFFREDRLTLFWQAVENLVSAGTALMFSYVNSVQVQDRFSLRSLEADLNTCSSLLWAMVERFPALKGTRDAFDTVVSTTLADLHHDVTSTAELGENISISKARRPYINGQSCSATHNGHVIDVLSPLTATRKLATDDDVHDHLQVGQSAVLDGSAVDEISHITFEMEKDSTDNFNTPCISVDDNMLFSELDPMALDWEAFPDTNFQSVTWL